MALANTPAHRFVRAYLQEHRRPGLPRAESLRYHANLMREAWTMAHRRYGNPLTYDETKYVQKKWQAAAKLATQSSREHDQITQARRMGEHMAYGDVLGHFGARSVSYSDNPAKPWRAALKPGLSYDHYWQAALAAEDHDDPDAAGLLWEKAARAIPGERAYDDLATSFWRAAQRYRRNPLTATERDRMLEMYRVNDRSLHAARGKKDREQEMFHVGKLYGYDDVRREFAPRWKPELRNPMPCPACRNPITVAANTVALDCPGCGATLGVR